MDLPELIEMQARRRDPQGSLLQPSTLPVEHKPGRRTDTHVEVEKRNPKKLWPGSGCHGGQPCSGTLEIVGHAFAGGREQPASTHPLGSR